MLILDEFWYGSIGLEAHTTGDDEYYRELKKLTELSETLSSTLSDEQRTALDRLSDQQIHVNALGEKDAFVSGVRFGVKMMVDVLCDADLRCPL